MEHFENKKFFKGVDLARSRVRGQHIGLVDNIVSLSLSEGLVRPHFGGRGRGQPWGGHEIALLPFSKESQKEGRTASSEVWAGRPS